MAKAQINFGEVGGGGQYYHATSMPSNGVVDCGFVPKYISVTAGNGVSCHCCTWQDTDPTNYFQYWGTSKYTYAVGSNNHGFASVGANGFTGFTYDTDYASKVIDIYAE